MKPMCKSQPAAFLVERNFGRLLTELLAGHHFIKIINMFNNETTYFIANRE